MITLVGRQVDYSVTVTNPGPDPLEGLIVIDEVPHEVRVLGVPFVPGVDAVQIGSHGGAEDIVWVLKPLAPGATLRLPWSGTVAEAGDFAAVNSVTARIRSADDRITEVKTTDTSYLASRAMGATKNPPFSRTEKRVVERPATDVGDGSTLPATGMDPGAILALGLAAIAGGIIVLLIARPSHRRRTSALLLVVLVGVAACTSSSTPKARNATSPSPEATEDRVLGERIEADDVAPEETAPEDGNTGTEVAPPEDGTPAVPVPAPPPVPPIVTVELVEIGPEDLPVESVGSFSGDNTVTFEWDEPSRAFGGVTSGRVVRPGAVADLLTSVQLGRGSIHVVMTLTNLTDDRRLEVKGRLVQEVFDASGASVVRLESAPIDVVLDPGGTTVATFDYLLPSGTYGVEAAFVENRAS